MGFGNRLLTTFFSTGPVVATIAALVLGAIPIWAIPDDSHVSKGKLITAAVAVVWLLYLLVRVAQTAIAEADVRQRAPKVINAFPSPKRYNRSTVSILVEPTWYLSHSAAISIYLLDRGVEQLVALGVVANIQDNGMVQISILDDDDNKEYVESIKRNDKDVLKSIVVKPTLPSSYSEIFLT